MSELDEASKVYETDRARLRTGLDVYRAASTHRECAALSHGVLTTCRVGRPGQWPVLPRARGSVGLLRIESLVPASGGLVNLPLQ
jgi:hypothetical protein